MFQYLYKLKLFICHVSLTSLNALVNAGLGERLYIIKCDVSFEFQQFEMNSALDKFGFINLNFDSQIVLVGLIKNLKQFLFTFVDLLS